MIKLNKIILKDTIGIAEGFEYSLSGPVTEIRSEDEELLGYIDYSVYSSKKSIKINTIELFQQYRRNGYGTLAINKLKNTFKGYSIFGQCALYESSKNFWKKQGAIFSDCCNCKEYSECGGDVDSSWCDEPLSFSFTIPYSEKPLHNEILISNEIDKNIPIIVIGLEDYYIGDEDCQNSINDICKNLISLDSSSIYVSHSSEYPMLEEMSNFYYLPNWHEGNSKEFIEIISTQFENQSIQLVGIYRELCLTQAASIIKGNIPNIEPIIINNDSYSVSATYSVMHGDTIDRMLVEKNFLPRYI